MLPLLLGAFIFSVLTLIDLEEMFDITKTIKIFFQWI